MAVINIIVTDAGLAEVINAEQTGTAPVVLTEVGLGAGQYTPSADQTALKSEFKRLSTIAGGSIGDNAIHLTASDESDDAYTVYEFGIYTASGTLFAVFSQPVAILQKAAAAHALLAMDIVVTNIDPDSVAVGDTNFQLNSATTTKQGIVELATAAEVVAGTDGFRAVTPSALTARTATTGRTGLVELATTAETHSGTDTERAVTPAALKTELDVRESRVVHTVNSVKPDSAGNVTVTDITGNAGTATKLKTARKINGVAFDGTKDITVEDNTKLPLSGGTMTGTIFTNTPYVIRVPKNDGFININGDTDNGGGAYIQIFGRNHSTNPGEIKLIANTTDSAQTLRLQPDGTLKWGGVDVLNPVGTVIAFAANSAPSGYLLCNGSAVSRTTYAALFAKIGTTYGAGDGSTTFNLPNLTDRFIQGSGTAGTVKNAGLPNITGHAEDLRSGGWSAGQNYNSGCVTQTFQSKLYANALSDSLGCLYGFNVDASKSNSIYGASATVQPPALTMRFYIKY